jgi:translation initiation factor IF-2
VGDVILAGDAHGRIRAMFDHQGNPVEVAPPSTPISVLGLSEVPIAGELFTVIGSQKEARAIVSERKKQQEVAVESKPAMTLEQVFEAFQAGETQELRLVVKADAQGSLEPIVSSLNELSVGDISINVLHRATGNISRNDVMLAAASDAIVIGFNVSADKAAQQIAEVEGVDIRTYDVIYRLTEDVEKALKGMLEPEKRLIEIGRAEILQVFHIPKLGNIAGCRVLQGELRRNVQMRVIRADEVLHEGPVSSLRHEKDDVREIREGFECGVGLKGFDDFEPGDHLVAFLEEMVPVE